MAKLLASYREWRTRNSASQQFDTAEFASIDFCYRTFDYLPMRAIVTEGVTRVFIDFDGCRKGKTCGLKTNGLSSRPGADFQNSQNATPKGPKSARV